MGLQTVYISGKKFEITDTSNQAYENLLIANPIKIEKSVEERLKAIEEKLGMTQ